MIRHYKDKIHLLSDIIKNRENIKNEQEQTILITGCFDILHPGHIGMFQEAKELGGKVFVGIKSNDAIHISEKGITGRPFNESVNRLSSFSFPSIIKFPLNILCRQCSEFTCENPKTSESVKGLLIDFERDSK